MKNFKRACLLVLLITAPVWLLACGNSNNGNNTDGSFGTEVSSDETADTDPSIATSDETQAKSQGIDIALRALPVPEHPRGDYVPFSNCQRDNITKFKFYVDNKGEEVRGRSNEIAHYGSVQIKRLSDGAVLLQEEAVKSLRTLAWGAWMDLKFDPIDLSQPGLYEITVESYLVDLPAYVADKTLKPIDADLSDNKLVYLNKVVAPESLVEDKEQVFDLAGVQTKMDFAQQGWDYGYLPNVLHLTDNGIGGSRAIETRLRQVDGDVAQADRRKIYTPPMRISNFPKFEMQFKLLDAQSGENLTEELMASKGVHIEFTLQDICKRTNNISFKNPKIVHPAEDGFFIFSSEEVKFDFSGDLRGEIEFYNLSDYSEITLIIDSVLIGTLDAEG